MCELDTLRDVIRGFSPAWFTVSMGTGIVSMLLYGFPYEWSPLKYIAMGIALLDLLTFVVTLVLFTWRMVQYRDFFNILLHPQMSMSLGAAPMAFTTLITSIVTILAPYEVAWMPTLALVLWCINIVFAVLSFLAIPFLVTSHQKHAFENVNATLLLPVVPTVVTSSAGALVASVHSGTTAVAVVLISYALWAIGVGISLMLLTFYVVRLVLHKLPPPDTIISAFIPLGVLGQASYAIQLMGVQALRVFPDGLSQMTYLGEVLHDLGFFIGFLFWSLAVWWLAHAIYSVLYTRFHGPVPFNLGWWTLIFPTGSFISSSTKLWYLTGYTFFRVLVSIMSVGVITLWIFVTLNTIRYAWTGELLKPINIRHLELHTYSENKDIQNPEQQV
ncbi:Plasma membrane sulfite pump involved in sulfite metabolism [Coemansia sp. RSA 2167]|nr:Plasma membrane sulfite pump involved in sulfite metabolism [Coemansia sp. RSA 1752]KAJ1772356.1 Plasma membrane sulfite pump involved in sulfite metabolism [Coemansia sp. RSA 1824]KAJ1787923.1 Plasma membrane sulfite pump involved in sulfite metabolism [Coemansia sp. RSA 2167]